MKTKRVLLFLTALAAILAVGWMSSRWMTSRQPEICQICSRQIPQQTEFRMVKNDGGSLDACCPRCAMHYLVDHPDAIRQAWATDYYSREKIAAESAYYDEGGDVQYCTAHAQPFQRAPEGVEVRTYDRCLPTLVAFRTRQEADTYRQQHGGRVLTFTEALESVRGQ